MHRRRRVRDHWPLVFVMALGAAACTSPGSASGAVQTRRPTVTGTSHARVAETSRTTIAAVEEPSPESVIAGGVPRGSLRLDDDGSVIVQLTPLPLRTRTLATKDTLPSPSGDSFEFRIAPLSGDPLERSTWSEACPVTVEELRYLNVSFLGFDDLVHTGELIVHADHAEPMVSVFRKLYEAGYPIEEMRIVEPEDLLPPSDGDVNNTTAFVCRAVAGTNTFSQHAFGRAVDINPFQNPYVRRSVVIPPLAMAFADRTWQRRGMIAEGDVVVAAFDSIGWQWGGRWQSLKDFQHFSHTGR